MSEKTQSQLLKSIFGNAAKFSLLFNSGQILEYASERYLERKAFPEPFDVASHVGNFREGAMATVAAFGMIGLFTMLEPAIDNAREKFKRGAQKAAAGAFAVSSTIQIVGENFELTNAIVPGGHNTGDTLDAAYGIAWSAVTAYTGYRMVAKLEEQHHARMLEQEQVIDQYLAERQQ
jgi:hypothetical protein